MSVSFVSLVMGIVFLGVGLLYMFRNKDISNFWRRIAGKLYRTKLEAKGVKVYARIRTFIGGTILAILGILMILGSF